MTEETLEMLDAPDTCEVTIEYDNRIEDEDVIEIEPEEDEQDDPISRMSLGESEQTFARYERNFRARRLKELTTAPLVEKTSRADREPAEIAA